MEVFAIVLVVYIFILLHHHIKRWGSCRTVALQFLKVGMGDHRPHLLLFKKALPGDTFLPLLSTHSPIPSLNSWYLEDLNKTSKEVPHRANQ